MPNQKILVPNHGIFFCISVLLGVPWWSKIIYLLFFMAACIWTLWRSELGEVLMTQNLDSWAQSIRSSMLYSAALVILEHQLMVSCLVLIPCCFLLVSFWFIIQSLYCKIEKRINVLVKVSTSFLQKGWCIIVAFDSIPTIDTQKKNCEKSIWCFVTFDLNI